MERSVDAEVAAILRALWAEFEVASEERSRIVRRRELLTAAGCPPEIALRTALDEWLQRSQQGGRQRGEFSSYLKGAHWARVKRVGSLLANDKCEGWMCGARHRLQGHHNHYETTGNESLFDIAVLCDDCHHRVTYGDAFYAEQLIEKRENERAEAAQASIRVAEAGPAFKSRLPND